MKKVTAVFLGIVLLGSSLAMPAQAQSFGIFFGDEPSDFFSDDDFFEPRGNLCLTDRQIRQAIADQGYSDIALNLPNDRNIQVRATQDGYVYLIDFDFCANRIEGRERIRPAG